MTLQIEAMTLQINVAEAKAKLSELLDRAVAGEEIVIARRQAVGAPGSGRGAAYAEAGGVARLGHS